MAWMIPITSAAADRRRGDEDRLLASLIQQDTGQRYEFKILHGGPRAFRGQERLQQILEQESRAQWELAMKLDDARLVLRRTRDARSRDVLRGGEIDPYRTELGSTGSIAAITVALAVVTGLFVALLSSSGVETGIRDATILPTIGLVAIAFIVLVKVALNRRR